MIAKILVKRNIKELNKVYDYIVPKNMEVDIAIGKRVLVNFGRGIGNDIFGIVVKIEQDCKLDKQVKLKEIIEIIDKKSFLNPSRFSLAKWISKMYFCNVYTALNLFLPSMTPASIKQKTLLGKQASIITLNMPIDIIEKDIASGKIKSNKQIRLLRTLNENEYIFLHDAINNLGISKYIINTVKDNQYIKISKKDIENDNYDNIERTDKLTPTEEQKNIIESLNKKILKNNFNVSLLYGITGSGKTEVYLQAIDYCIKCGKTAIVLVPEISLTYQTKLRFISRFGNIVSVLHSKMTVLERETEYKRIIENKVSIVIGPRSALFVPLNKLGLIIIDEEHDTSYISQNAPKYNTKEVATRIAYENNCMLLLGSATPEISTMYKAKTGKIDYYELTKRPCRYKLPDVFVVDMKKECVIGNVSLISTKLKQEIEKNIQNKQQTFIFLNRRGHSTFLMCKDCGHIFKCPNCDFSLTYHNKINLLLCHYCSYVEKLKNNCPICFSKNIIISGTGTQKIEEQLQQVFPNANIIRMDIDTTLKKGAHEEILKKFKSSNVDILVGTQMISKGHDIENVTLVGIINADSTFVRTDIFSSEKAFSNLLQVSGRAGRGNKKGRVIVQAYDVDSYIIDAIRKQDYFSFYDKEIKYRNDLNYPPFTDIVVLEIIGKNKETVIKESNKIYNVFLRNNGNKYIIYSPKTPYISKIKNKYRIQIIIKAKINDEIINLLYQNMSKYDKIKNRQVELSITKNPPI